MGDEDDCPPLSLVFDEVIVAPFSEGGVPTDRTHPKEQVGLHVRAME